MRHDDDMKKLNWIKSENLISRGDFAVKYHRDRKLCHIIILFLCLMKIGYDNQSEII